MNDLSWNEIIDLHRGGFGSVFSVGDKKTATVSQYSVHHEKTGTVQAPLILISKTKFNGLTFFIQKHIISNCGRVGTEYIGDDERSLCLENFLDDIQTILPDCYQYIADTTQKHKTSSYYNETFTGKVCVPSSDTMSVADYFTSDSSRRISDGAYFLADVLDDCNAYVTSSGRISSSGGAVGGEVGGITAIFTLR